MIRSGPGAHQTHPQRSHPAGGHHHGQVQTGLCGVRYTQWASRLFTLTACWSLTRLSVPGSQERAADVESGRGAE